MPGRPLFVAAGPGLFDSAVRGCRWVRERIDRRTDRRAAALPTWHSQVTPDSVYPIVTFAARNGEGDLYPDVRPLPPERHDPRAPCALPFDAPQAESAPTRRSSRSSATPLSATAETPGPRVQISAAGDSAGGRRLPPPPVSSAAALAMSRRRSSQSSTALAAAARQRRSPPLTRRSRRAGRTAEQPIVTQTLAATPVVAHAACVERPSPIRRRCSTRCRSPPSPSNCSSPSSTMRRSRSPDAGRRRGRDDRSTRRVRIRTHGRRDGRVRGRRPAVRLHRRDADPVARHECR